MAIKWARFGEPSGLFLYRQDQIMDAKHDFLVMFEQIRLIGVACVSESLLLPNLAVRLWLLNPLDVRGSESLLNLRLARPSACPYTTRPLDTRAGHCLDASW